LLFPQIERAHHAMGPSAGPRITLHGLTRARSTLEDFVSSYFMFHGLDPTKPTDVFAHLPVLSFTEAVIYELDDANEDVQYGETDMKDVKDTFENLMRRLEEHFGEEHFRFVETPLRRELSQGLEYWELERRLGPMLAAGTRLTDEDMAHSLDAVKKKSFDYRVLNLVLLASVRKRRKEAREEETRRRGTNHHVSTGTNHHAASATASEEHVAILRHVDDVPHGHFLAASELLVELSDDLYDYEEDVASTAFNFYRCVVNHRGAEAAPAEMAKVIQAAEREYTRLDDQLGRENPELARRCRERCAEATSEGLPGRQVSGEPTGAHEQHPRLGKWEIPAPIADERAYREEVMKTRREME